MARRTPRPRPTQTQTLTPVTVTCPHCKRPTRADYTNYRTVSRLDGTLRRIVRGLSRAAKRGGPARGALRHFVKVTRSYRPGLFHCYESAPAGAVPLLRVGGRAPDEQRPGATIRQLSVSRAAVERAEAGVAGSGGAGVGGSGVGAADAAGAGAGVIGGVDRPGAVAGVTRGIGTPPGGAAEAAAVPQRSCRLPGAA